MGVAYRITVHTITQSWWIFAAVTESPAVGYIVPGSSWMVTSYDPSRSSTYGTLWHILE